MKYGVTITYTERAYKEIEADNEEEAIDIVAMMSSSEYESLGDDDYSYEAEELEEPDEGNKDGT